MVVFCFGPLPGERARVRIVTVKQRYAVGRMLELLQASADRVDPFCPVFGECGGCQVQHLAYDAQLRWKRDIVHNALTRIAGAMDITVNPTIGMPSPRAYRNKMSLVVDHRKDPPSLGFYRQRSHDVVAIDGCPVVVEPLDATIRTLIASRTEGAFARMLTQARHLVARAGTAHSDVVLSVTTEEPAGKGSDGPGLLRELGVDGIENSYDLTGENAVLGRRHRSLAGSTAIEETVAGLRYRISAASFFQVNVTILERIFATMESWLARPAEIVDAYCGAGTFALFFARHGWRVFGIEENRHAVQEAHDNARLNALEKQVTFTVGRVERVLAEAGNAALQRSRAIFLDPPRKGCDPAVLDAITSVRVPHVWYLSCDAATLARDLRFLLSKGYRCETVQPFDMFPQTGHVETLVRLEYATT
jgi:23S rRNA (uracil1939-C5)-methyltransferase